MAQQPTNEAIAALLEQIAQLLEVGEENPFRVRAYRNAAATISAAEESVADLAIKEDRRALTALPGIGEGLANLIIDYVKTGESALLRQLEEQNSPERALSQAPGIGEELARRIVEQLGIHTLEELEVAAHDGRLDSVEGFGPERVKAVKASLAGMLSDSAQRRARQRTQEKGEQPDEPSVAELLEVDAEYRRRAEAGELQKIAPKRFNPEGKAWLPVLHTRRGDWSFTVLFSNTARAHEAGKTHDWVVIYFERDGSEEEQRTVVTATQGDLTGKRIVRGQEAETRRHYAR
jgi:ribosomal protein S13